MNSIIEELIRLDRRARETVTAAEHRRDEARLMLSQKKEELSGTAAAALAEQAERKKSELDALLKQNLQDLAERFQKAESALDAAFTRDADTLVSDITAACLRREHSA